MPSLQELLAVRRPAVQPGAVQGTGARVEPLPESYALPADLTAAGVPALREALREWIARRQPGEAWCLHAAQVKSVDAAGLQLLLSVASRAAARYVRLRVLEPSAELRAVCAALGLDGVLLEPAFA